MTWTGPCWSSRVDDDGRGIDETLIDRLFEPYVTTKTKGTGLGLAIVKKIIEEHGGIIWADNAKGGARVARACPYGAMNITRKFPRKRRLPWPPRPRAPTPSPDREQA